MKPQELRQHIIYLENIAERLGEWARTDDIAAIHPHLGNRISTAKQSAQQSAAELRAVLKDMLIEEFLSDDRGVR
jgi:hypothetical protein